eukprot:scaffold37912_cov35-Phaeocystis_antarctica.AAC.1
MPWLSAAARAATHRSRGPPTCSGRPRHRAAWLACTRLPAHIRRFRRLRPSRPGAMTYAFD